MDVTNYVYSTHGFQYTLVLASESMTAGKFYQFQYRAINVMGSSAYSAVATFPVAAAPSKPLAAPALIKSTKSSLAIGWTRAVDTQAPAGTITGHYLYMDDGANGEFTLIFSGAGAPDVTQFTVSGTSILTGSRYRFYLVSENHVGLSTSSSDISAYRACVAPSGLEPPTRVATTSTSLSVAWSIPSDNGGCSITGFALLVGDEAAALSASDDIIYTEVHASEVNGEPSLNAFTITTLPSSVAVGTTLRVKL
jgi:hypothetical protein